MTQYERSRDGPCVLAYVQFTWRRSEQPFEAVVHVQLLEEDLHQGRRPPNHSGRGNRRTNGPRSNVPAPAFRRCLPGPVAASLRVWPRFGLGAYRRRSPRRLAFRRFSVGRHRELRWNGGSGPSMVCFTANAILRTQISCELAGFSRSPANERYGFRVCATQSVIRWEECARRLRPYSTST
jgi:hypothetical protein